MLTGEDPGCWDVVFFKWSHRTGFSKHFIRIGMGVTVEVQLSLRLNTVEFQSTRVMVIKVC